MRLEDAFRQLNIVQDFIPRTNSNRPGTPLRATYITIHNTDNTGPGADAAAHARYVKGADAQRRQVSWHYTVDDRIVYQSLPANEIGWHAGVGNRTSIGIEICMHRGMPERPAYERAALLVAVLAHTHGIAIPGRVVQHHHWTGKHCPRVLRDRPNGWAEFVARTKELFDELHASEMAVEVATAEPDLTHHCDDNACEILNEAAPPGAVSGAARRRPRGKARKRRRTSKATKQSSAATKRKKRSTRTARKRRRR